jgi:hypothetical protein
MHKRLKSPYTLAVIVLLFTAVLVWQFYKYKIVNKSIQKTVSEKSKGLYSITYDNIILDEVSGTLHVKNIRIIPDSGVFNDMLKEKKAPSLLVKLTIPALDILRIKTPKALLSKEIEGGKIEISNPSVEILMNDFSKDSIVHNPGKDIYKQLLGKFLKIKIDSIEIKNAAVVIKNITSNLLLLSGNNVSCMLGDLRIDSIANKDSSRILFSKNADISCAEVLLPSQNKRYHLYVQKLRFTNYDNSLYIGSIKFTPLLSEDEFAKSFPTQKDRYNFTLKDTRLININRESLWHKKIEADTLLISESSFKIYRDLSYPRDTLSRIGKYPWEQLMHLSVPFYIKKAILSNSFIEYKEKNAKSDSAGKVQFYAVHAVINNITNIPEYISGNNQCVLIFNAKFLNKAAVNAKLIMFLNNRHGNFFIKGNIGSLNALALNPLTQPMGLASIEKGYINKLDFDFTGNDSASKGKITMLYNDVKISLLKKNNGKNKYDKKNLESLLANTILKKSNPDKNDKLRVADVRYKRDINKSFFNLLWKTVFTGIKQTAGMKL